MAYLLAVDQGTTSSRAIVFNAQGQIVSSAQKPFELYTPHAGWVEQDAWDIWNTQIACIQEAIGRAGLLAKDIQGIGITNQRETTVLWHRKTGRPIAPAIVWQDRRTATWCQDLQAQGHADRIQSLTGLLLDPYFSAGKIAWLLEHVKGARELAEQGDLAFGTIDSWLIWHLTHGLHVTNVSNASRRMLMDLQTCQWSEK